LDSFEAFEGRHIRNRYIYIAYVCGSIFLVLPIINMVNTLKISNIFFYQI
jgi:hypothetical protein